MGLDEGAVNKLHNVTDMCHYYISQRLFGVLLMKDSHMPMMLVDRGIIRRTIQE